MHDLVIQIQKKFPAFGTHDWHLYLAGLVPWFLLLIAYIIAKSIGWIQFRGAAEEEQGPSHFNKLQICVTGGLMLVQSLFLFKADWNYLMSGVALTVTVFVLLDKNVLWSTRRASSHATDASAAARQAGQQADAARSSVEEAKTKIDLLKKKSEELVEKVRQLQSVEPLPFMISIVNRLTDLFLHAHNSRSSMLLSATPAIGLTGAEVSPTEAEKKSAVDAYIHYERAIEDAARCQGCNLKIICYNKDGRRSFYSSEQKIRDDGKLNQYETRTAVLLQRLADAVVIPIEIERHDSPETRCKPLLDGVHFAIVNWDPAHQDGAEAVIWHLEIDPQDGGSIIDGAGFWTSNHDIIRTFQEVFDGRYQKLKGDK